MMKAMGMVEVLCMEMYKVTMAMMLEMVVVMLEEMGVREKMANCVKRRHALGLSKWNRPTFCFAEKRFLRKHFTRHVIRRTKLDSPSFYSSSYYLKTVLLNSI